MIVLSNVSYSVKSEDDSDKIILSDINLRIEKGARVGIMGRNGSGKTTLMKLIAGLIFPSSGEVSINDLATTDPRFQANLGKTAGIVFQNPEHQMVTVTVEREVALGLENYGFMTEAIHHNVDSQLAKYHLDHLRNKAPIKISGGEKQKLALSSVMILGPEILALDEPMSHLDSEGIKIFRTELEQIMEAGDVTILYITQDLSEVIDYDRVLILDNGEISEDCAPEDLIQSTDLLGKCAIEYPPELIAGNISPDKISEGLAELPDNSAPANSNPENKISLECKNLYFAWRGNEEIIENLNLTLHRGLVHGLLGKIGCGKSTLALLLSGLLKPLTGKIDTDGKTANQADLIREVSYIFQSPERGLFATTLYEDIEYGPKNFGYVGEDLKSMVRKAFGDVGLDLESFRERSPHTLSGGEARLAGIAGGLATGKNIIVLDEPTEELDYQGRLQIISLIKNLGSGEKALLIISHNSDFLFNVCHEVSIWSGKGVVTFPKLELYHKPDIFAQAGIEIPQVIKLAQKMDLAAEFKKKVVVSLGDLLPDRPGLIDLRR